MYFEKKCYISIGFVLISVLENTLLLHCLAVAYSLHRYIYIYSKKLLQNAAHCEVV